MTSFKIRFILENGYCTFLRRDRLFVLYDILVTKISDQRYISQPPMIHFTTPTLILNFYSLFVPTPSYCTLTQPTVQCAAYSTAHCKNGNSMQTYCMAMHDVFRKIVFPGKKK